MYRTQHFYSIICLLFLPVLPALPDPNPAQPFLVVSPSSPANTTIPAFPEQSDVSGCPLDLPDDLFASVKSACTGRPVSSQLSRSRCCPVLAAWLYSAYSATALSRTLKTPPQIPTSSSSSSYDLPLLPDDSETCVDSLEKGLRSKGIELSRPNETCDLVYCECGIRLHPLSCTEAFSFDSDGGLIGNKNVKRLERDCLGNAAVLGGCSKCLKTLHLLSKVNTGNTSNAEDRTNKMHNKDCELMGLTWLLAKNRSAYIHTVSAVLRAMMMSTDEGFSPQSCSLNTDGMPLAVDSSQINSSSSSNTVWSPLCLSLLSLLIFYVSVSLSIRQLLDSM